MTFQVDYYERGLHEVEKACFPTGYDGDNAAIELLIPSDGISLVLDVGCGRGGTAARLSQKGIKVDGVSWLPEELEVAKQFCRRVIQSDVNNGIPDIGNNTYDCVICSHILEHIAYPQRLLTDIRRGLVPGGYLLVAIPNVFFWRDRLKLMVGHWDYQESGTFDYTHLRWYTKNSLETLLIKHDFISDGFFAEGWLPLPGLRFLVGSYLRTRVNKFACWLSPGLFGQQLVFRFRKPA
jgi:SAM-dependent methyltransferase